MAVPQNTLIGKTRQSVGNVTFTTWKGINVIKSKPVSVADPKTQLQLDQRAKLKNFVIDYRLNSAVINAGFKQQAVKMSAYNAAASANLLSGSMSSDPGTPIGDFSFFKVAKGSLYYTEMLTYNADFSTKIVTLTWSPVSVADQLDTDKVYATIYNSNGYSMANVLGTATRDQGTISISIPDMPAVAQELHGYLFFVQTGTGKVSDSFYNTIPVVA